MGERAESGDDGGPARKWARQAGPGTRWRAREEWASGAESGDDGGHERVGQVGRDDGRAREGGRAGSQETMAGNVEWARQAEPGDDGGHAVGPAGKRPGDDGGHVRSGPGGQSQETMARHVREWARRGRVRRRWRVREEWARRAGMMAGTQWSQVQGQALLRHQSWRNRNPPSALISTPLS